jgi:predicted anti-sigma-YlaC factor YlaD
MFCDEFLETAEAIAAGDVTPDARVDAHLATCVNCARALSAARRVERLLKARAVPQAPPQFTARVLSRIRGDRWRREQFLDAGFNLAIGVIVIALVAGLWMLFSQSGMSRVARDAFNVLGSSGVGFIERAARSLPLYLGAAGALATALGVWWWAERDASF